MSLGMDARKGMSSILTEPSSQSPRITKNRTSIGSSTRNPRARSSSRDMSSRLKLERYGGSKVRTGCVTCKQRRVKCDETKPTCHRCAKAGRQCSGYAPPPPKDRNVAGQPLVIISYLAPDHSISLLPGVATQEKRSLEFFKQHTLVETFATPEWPEHLLRTSNHEDSVRHAIVALGALHEHFSATTQTDEDFAMRQYSKAMKQIMKLDMASNTSTDTALISCILFACIESLQGHYRSSLLHIKSGLQILKEQQTSGVADEKVAYISKEVLRPMFLRFVTQSREIGDDQVRLMWDSIMPNLLPSPISGFETYHDAHESMGLYLHDFVQFLGRLQPDPERDLAELQSIVEYHGVLTSRHEDWCQAFDKLLENGAVASQSDVAKLQIWRTAVDLTLGLDVSLGEMAWDRKTEKFRDIVRLAEIVVEEQPRGYHCVSNEHAMSSTQVSGPSLPSHHHEDPLECDATKLSLSEVAYCQSISPLKKVFSIDLGIIAPLYIVIWRCRDPAIRRRGLQLLASCNRREGIWDSTLTARVAERIIAIEEAGATSHPVLYASQIPERARVRDLNTKFGLDRQGLIKYTKSVDCVGPDDKYEELLEW